MEQPIRIEREIVSYDNETEEQVGYFNIDLIPFEKIKSIVVPEEDDPKLFNGYLLTNEQVMAFNKELGGIINIDFKNHYYVLECTGIYK
jgi:hypothetical protein